jgi:hypothetical protein
VDRTRAWSNLAAGLLAGAIAIGLFGLTFFAALLYLA